MADSFLARKAFSFKLSVTPSFHGKLLQQCCVFNFCKFWVKSVRWCLPSKNYWGGKKSLISKNLNSLDTPRGSDTFFMHRWLWLSFQEGIRCVYGNIGVVLFNCVRNISSYYKCQTAPISLCQATPLVRTFPSSFKIYKLECQNISMNMQSIILKVPIFIWSRLPLFTKCSILEC